MKYGISSSVRQCLWIEIELMSLQTENEQLESKIATLTKELSVLKDLFMEHARGFCGTNNSVHLSPEQLEKLLGCKAIRNNLNAETSSGNCTHAAEPESSHGLSSIQPLINAAEIEFMGLKEDANASVTTVTDSLVLGSHTTIYEDLETSHNTPGHTVNLVRKGS